MTLVNTETGEIVARCSPDEARELTDRIRVAADSLWSLLAEAHDREAWRALGYDTFKGYVEGELSMSKQRAYQLLDQARVIAAISEASGSTTVDLSERQARRLKPHLDEVKQEIEDRLAAGEDPDEAVRSTLADDRADESPAGPVVVEDDGREPEVSAGDLTIPWSFHAETSEAEPRLIREAAKYFDQRAVRSADVFARHMANFPARYREQAAVIAQQQVQLWQDAVKTLSRPSGLRSAR